MRRCLRRGIGAAYAKTAPVYQVRLYSERPVPWQRSFARNQIDHKKSGKQRKHADQPLTDRRYAGEHLEHRGQHESEDDQIGCARMAVHQLVEQLRGHYNADAQADEQRQEKRDLQSADRCHCAVVQIEHQQQVGNTDARQDQRRCGYYACDHQIKRLYALSRGPVRPGRGQADQKDRTDANRDINGDMPGKPGNLRFSVDHGDAAHDRTDKKELGWIGEDLQQMQQGARDDQHPQPCADAEPEQEEKVLFHILSEIADRHDQFVIDPHHHCHRPAAYPGDEHGPADDGAFCRGQE